MMMFMMTITYFSEKKKKNREEIRVPEFGGWGRNKGFWQEYLPMEIGRAVTISI